MFVKQFKINFDEIVALWFAFEWTFQISWKKNAEVLLKSQNLIYGNLPIYKVLHSEGSFRILGIKVTKNKTMEIKQNYLSLSFLSAFVLRSQEHRGNIPIKRIVVWSFNKDLNSYIVRMSVLDFCHIRTYFGEAASGKAASDQPSKKTCVLNFYQLQTSSNYCQSKWKLYW